MRAKATWKPVGHSAKKWREATHRRGSLLKPGAAPPMEKGYSPKKKPFG
jgi:hypothetical protein